MTIRTPTLVRAARLRSAALAALVALPGAGSALAQDVLRVGTEGAYPPFNAVEADGSLTGFDVDIARALCERMERECEFVTQDWDGIIPALQADRYDMIVASMFITEDRKKQVDFTDPYYKAAMTWVVPKASGLNKFTTDSLDGANVGTQIGTTQADYVTGEFPDANLRVYPTQDEVNLDLANGRLDAQVADLIPMTEWLKTDEGQCCELGGEPITDPEFVGEGVGIALRQEDDELREAVNAALAEILEDGTYQEINDRYFDINIYTLQ